MDHHTKRDERTSFPDPGADTSDLAIEAVNAALADAGSRSDQVDALDRVMTPDYIAPGIAGLVQTDAGLGHVAPYDIRQQCSGFL